MPENYEDFRREPSKPHQCMHCSEEDGTRCRAIAMHNEIMCYHHRSDTILPVIENEPFLLEDLDTREAIQKALGQVARQLACNRMDFERAKLLIHVITAAMRNLPPHPRPTRSQPTPTQTVVIPTEGDASVAEVEGPPHLARPTSTAQAIPTNPAANSPTEDQAPPAGWIDYETCTEDEQFYLCSTVFGGHEPSRPRPPSLTREAVEAHFNAHRKKNGFTEVLPPKAPLTPLPPHLQPKSLPTIQAVSMPPRPSAPDSGTA